MDRVELHTIILSFDASTEVLREDSGCLQANMIYDR